MPSLRSLLVATAVVACRALSKEDVAMPESEVLTKGDVKPVVEFQGVPQWREGLMEEFAATKLTAFTALDEIRRQDLQQGAPECGDSVDAEGCHAAGCRCVAVGGAR